MPHVGFIMDTCMQDYEVSGKSESEAGSEAGSEAESESIASTTV
jgi:hypothetical protein